MPGVTEQEIAQAKQMNLYQYMQLCEPDNFKPEGPGQFRHKGHSSLTFAEDGSWTYFKTKATGRTALNYLIAVEGVSFVEAVREINRIQGGVRPSFQPVKAPSPPAEKKPAKEFRLPKPDKNNYAATAYLRKRCIHPNVLTVCKQKKILYQTSFKDHPNCVFVGRDGNGEPKGGSFRGCSQIQFRRDIPGSKKIYPFYIEAAANADTVEVYEAPIDAMSGASLKIMQHTGNWRGVHYLALGGTDYAALDAFLTYYPNITHIVLCLDNDEAGRTRTEDICVKYSRHRLMPQKEYGSARWGGPEDIAPFLNENPQNNLPLTASESLSLSPKMKVTANDNYNRNKNVIVFGPSGSGKSYSVAGPQLLQFNSNYVLSDPKGELLQEYGNVLLSQGYKVKVFNLKDRDKSDHYNLFAYIKNEDDILVVTKNLVKNLKEDPTAKSTADPIWEEGMTALLEALIGYVFYELEPEERNMNSVMTLLLMLESQGDGPNSVSQLDLLFDDLSINKPNSFAAKQYKLYKMAPGKTAQSINVSLGLRMSAFNIPSIANICADDTIDLRELGSEKKVALFVVTPDTTTAYNFLAAVMFQQCFQILVDIADHRPDKRLPRHLRFLLDEFPNIGMIPDFQILISTIRSRDIACTLIYQSLNQLKSQYKDDWATIYENCDSMIVLGAGGNPENLEFFSKALGKATIEVMNTSENKGSQGSYTKSYQALGRELMTPEEIRTMPRNWCLLMISGVAPFYSRKYNLKDHPNYHLVEAEGGKPFDYDRRAEQSFADFISNVKDLKTVKLCAENNN